MTTKKSIQDCPHCEVGEKLPCQNGFDCKLKSVCLTEKQDTIAESGY